MRFIADSMLGKLAVWLRILGYDTAYKGDVEDAALLEEAEAEGRLVLTRDTRLVKRMGARPYFFINDDAPMNQLREVVQGLGLRPREAALLSRCTSCNGVIGPAERESVQGVVPEHVFEHTDRFRRCPSCGRVYWGGSHTARILRRLGSAGIRLG